MPVLPSAANGRTTKLRLLLMDVGLPQYKLAALLDVSPTRLSEYALGRRPIPTNRIYHFCTVLSVSPTELIGWDDE